jgi:hypothetical protein
MDENYYPGLRFDVEGEEGTNNISTIYDFFMQSAMGMRDWQTQKLDFVH